MQSAWRVNMEKTTGELGGFTREVLQLMPAIFRGMIKTQSDDIARGVITIPQFIVLDLLLARGPIKMSQIALEMGVSMPAATGLVERLHQIGMIERCYDKKDRRVIRIDVTVKGRRAVGRVRSQREKLIRRVFGKLNPGERKSYLSVLRKVHQVLYKG